VPFARHAPATTLRPDVPPSPTAKTCEAKRPRQRSQVAYRRPSFAASERLASKTLGRDEDAP
jgi:hypothetical protein